MLTRLEQHWLVARAWWSLLEFDLAAAFLGRTGLEPRQPAHAAAPGRWPAERLLDAMTKACRYYWQPVLCLQRSVCTVRILRRYGVRCRLVVGYRPTPFMSHAWVEIEGRVVNDSPVYAERMLVLHVL